MKKSFWFYLTNDYRTGLNISTFKNPPNTDISDNELDDFDCDSDGNIISYESTLGVIKY